MRVFQLKVSFWITWFISLCQESGCHATNKNGEREASTTNWIVNISYGNGENLLKQFLAYFLRGAPFRLAMVQLGRTFEVKGEVSDVKKSIPRIRFFANDPNPNSWKELSYKA